jgi:hypothetical protein
MEQRNPYMEQFIRRLIEQKGERLEPDAHERLVEDLNHLLENMIGKNMIAALPEDVRARFVSQYEKGSRDVDAATLSSTFGRYLPDASLVMKETLREFAALYFRNR